MADTSSFDYDTKQQLYCLSAASNAVTDRIATQEELQQQMQHTLDKCIPTLKGDWKVTWGPAVHKDLPWLPGAATNAWYVAKSESQKLCCVAIAGTATNSIEGWLGDITVVRVVNFEDWINKWTPAKVPTPSWWWGSWSNPKHTLAALGTCSFTYNIVSARSPHGAASPGTTLGEHLRDNVTGYDLVFTGHSMGGAVCPAVALGLSQHDTLSGARSVRVLMSAGPTPGNSVFKQKFVEKFPSGDGYNTDYFNKHDVIPQIFSLNTSDDRHVSQILDIYKAAGGAALERITGFAKLIRELADHTMPYSNLPGTSIDGPDVPSITTADELGRWFGIQHMTAYWEALGIGAFVDTVNKHLGASGLAKQDSNLDFDKIFSGLQAAIDSVPSEEDTSASAPDDTAA